MKYHSGITLWLYAHWKSWNMRSMIKLLHESGLSASHYHNTAYQNQNTNKQTKKSRRNPSHLLQQSFKNVSLKEWLLWFLRVLLKPFHPINPADNWDDDYVILPLPHFFFLQVNSKILIKTFLLHQIFKINTFVLVFKVFSDSTLSSVNTRTKFKWKNQQQKGAAGIDASNCFSTWMTTGCIHTFLPLLTCSKSY